jgi:hypothetical protein
MTLASLLPDLRRAARAWRGCPPHERGLFVEAWLVLLWYWFRWRTGLGGALLSRGVAGGGSSAGTGTLAAGGSSAGDATLADENLPAVTGDIDPRATHVLAAFRNAAHNHVVRASCVPRSLALQRLLQRRGWAARIRVGVRRANGSIEGHAWVECDQLPLQQNGIGDGSFVACRHETGAL